MLTSLRASPQLSNVLKCSSGSVGSGSKTSFLSDSPEVPDRRADETLEDFSAGTSEMIRTMRLVIFTSYIFNLKAGQRASVPHHHLTVLYF